MDRHLQKYFEALHEVLPQMDETRTTCIRAAKNYDNHLYQALMCARAGDLPCYSMDANRRLMSKLYSKVSLYAEEIRKCVGWFCSNSEKLMQLRDLMTCNGLSEDGAIDGSLLFQSSVDRPSLVDLLELSDRTELQFRFIAARLEAAADQLMPRVCPGIDNEPSLFTSALGELVHDEEPECQVNEGQNTSLVSDEESVVNLTSGIRQGEDDLAEGQGEHRVRDLLLRNVVGGGKLGGTEEGPNVYSTASGKLLLEALELSMQEKALFEGALFLSSALVTKAVTESATSSTAKLDTPKSTFKALL